LYIYEKKTERVEQVNGKGVRELVPREKGLNVSGLKGAWKLLLDSGNKLLDLNAQKGSSNDDSDWNSNYIKMYVTILNVYDD
jgi:hypothetical protein